MHIFITGGTRGIGQGIVKEFLKKGHQVSFTGTSENSIKKGQEGLNGEYLALVCDVRYKDMITTAMKFAVDKFGDIDVWLNNAGVDQERLTVSELQEDEIKRVVEINITGTMLGTSVALEQMKKQGQGMVYNFEGLGSNNMAIPKTSIYGTSKRAITYFSKAARKEIRDYPNIYVGTIQPGMVFTDLLLHNLGDEGMKVARVIGNDVEYVTTRIVTGILNKKMRINIMSNALLMWRFMTSPFSKRNKHIK
ncbi:3-oxoacyl-[acyl-carrier-protein] reductase FabG [Candidatus Izimaplasma bacterium HR1]|uniref:SDR family oxidoreductase n=1 Tax=Candidatus Izimoplasma sp. HR1 TaxID=1541959 RepID=UPI0004F5D8F5|nr:3-oxoacyl-[acyl-carrier-protein] reductase FabG [Candidatus Izimaplasma bacterium HR1]